MEETKNSGPKEIITFAWLPNYSNLWTTQNPQVLCGVLLFGDKPNKRTMYACSLHGKIHHKLISFIK